MLHLDRHPKTYTQGAIKLYIEKVWTSASDYKVIFITKHNITTKKSVFIAWPDISEIIMKCYQNRNISKHYNVLKNKNLNSRDRH